MKTSEQIEEPLEHSSEWKRYVDIARRRHLHFFLILLSVWAVVWSATWILPARYKSSTSILVEQPTMPKSYVLPNINDNLQDRLQSITQQILSRTRLLTIIDKRHLYSDKHHSLTPDGKVQKMRKDISINLVRDQRQDTITAFTVAYSASTPAVAQEVTHELTQLFINDNSRLRAQQSQQTTTFLTDQMANAKTDLATQTEKVRNFEDQHQGALPTQQQSNLEILNGLQSQLQSERDELNNAKQQRVYLESLIQQYRATHALSAQPDNEQEGLQTLDHTLATLKAQLAVLRVRYTDSYPDIEDLKSRIANIEASRDAMLAAMHNSHGQTTFGDSSPGPQTDSNTALQQEISQLESQLQANTAKLTDRNHSVSDLLARINAYQGRLNAAPLIQQRLSDLSQGYDQSKKNYDALLTKANDSQMATSMELMQEGEHFQVLDPASFPLKPDFPNRLRFSALGAGLGFALGLIAVALLEFLDDRVHSREDIQTLLPAPLLSDIPTININNDAYLNRIRAAMGWITSVSATVLILAGTAYSYLHQ